MPYHRILPIACRGVEAPGLLEKNENEAVPKASMTRAPTNPPLEALPKRATRLQAQAVPSSPGPFDVPQRMSRLLHATMDPAVATAVLDEAGNGTDEVMFDGFGRISGFGKPSISTHLIQRLENAVMEPLTRTNAPGPREAARTERDLLTRAMHLLRVSGGPVNAGLRVEARKLFMSGAFSRDTVAAFLSTGREQLAGNDILKARFQELCSEIAWPVTASQRADNLYGRAFESFLVDDLVCHPPAGVSRAAGDLGQAVVRILNSHRPAVQDVLLSKLLHYINDDRRFWFDRSPTLQRFRQTPSMKALRECLEETSHGVESIKMPFIATQMALAIQEMEREDRISRPRWLRKADSFYEVFLRPQKPKEKTRFDGVPAGGSGNWLRHQPRDESMQSDGGGKDWTHARVVRLQRLSRFEEHALARGQTVVNGPSGTTNMMFFLGEHIARTNPQFSQADHHLNTLMFLVFDGGHSTHEVLATLDAISFSRGQGENRASKNAAAASFFSCGGGVGRASIKAAVASFSGGYAAIAELAGSEAEKQALRQRLDTALERTLDYFATHVARTGEIDEPGGGPYPPADG